MAHHRHLSGYGDIGRASLFDLSAVGRPPYDAHRKHRDVAKKLLCEFLASLDFALGREEVSRHAWAADGVRDVGFSSIDRRNF